MNKEFNLDTKDEIKREIDHQFIRLATELKEEIDDNFSKANEKLVNQVVLINTLKDRIDRAIEQLQIRNRQNESALTNREETIISKHELLKREIIENDFLIGLLKGSDNNDN